VDAEGIGHFLADGMNPASRVPQVPSFVVKRNGLVVSRSGNVLPFPFGWEPKIATGLLAQPFTISDGRVPSHADDRSGWPKRFRILLVSIQQVLHQVKVIAVPPTVFFSKEFTFLPRHFVGTHQERLELAVEWDLNQAK
jgi:hypothetical protein